MISVRDVLTTKAFNNSKVIAGGNGLSQMVSTVTVAEVPDAANWLRGGELVCTTAFFMSQDVRYQNKWIESLIYNGASALAVKTSRFLGTIPKSIIDIADQHNFPLIEMPPEITWPVVIESVMNLLTDQQTKVIQQAEQIHTKLTTLVLEDQSVQVIANAIADIVHNPIIIEDARLNLISIGKVSLDESSLKYQEEIINKRIEESFRIKILQTNFYKSVLKGRKKDKYQINISLEKKSEYRLIMIPILSNKVLYGFISLIDVIKPHTPMDLIALEHGTTALALQFMKQMLHQQTLRTKTLAIIEDLVNGRFHTEIVLDQNLYNIDWSKPMIAMVMEILLEQLDEKDYGNQTQEFITTTLRKYIEKKFDKAIIGNNASQFTILVSFHPETIENATNMLKEVLIKALVDLERLFGRGNFRIGVGGAYNKLDLLGKSYKEANSALSICKTFSKHESIVLFEDLGVHRIISMIHNVDELRALCEDFLSELKNYDRQNGSELIQTLHAYLKCDYGINETAKMLFVHPNTVLYRMKKIRKIIKRDLNRVENKLLYLFVLEADGACHHPNFVETR